MEPFVLWITGMPGSGKSAVSDGIKIIHPDLIVLRMDEMRRIVTPEPTYSEEERDIVYRSLVYMALTLSDNGHSLIIDATGNLRKWRDLARSLIRNFAEVYLKCPLEVCIARERVRVETHSAPRDVYRKAETGWPIPGISAPYEEPVNPELLIEVERVSLPETVRQVDGLIRAMQKTL
jgi:adenylylsulfate kinase